MLLQLPKMDSKRPSTGRTSRRRKLGMSGDGDAWIAKDDWIDAGDEDDDDDDGDGDAVVGDGDDDGMEDV